MRAAGLLPLLPLLLLLGVSSQDDADSTTPGQTTTSVATETTVMTTSAATTEASPTTSAATTTAEITTTTTEKPPQTTVTTPTATQSTTTAQSITTADLGKPPSPAAMSSTTVLQTTPTPSGNTEPATTTTAHTSGQDSSSHSAGSPTATPAASSASSQQLSGATASSGSSGSTSAANPVPTTGSSPPGAVGAATISSPKQPQGNQPLDPSPNTTLSTTVTRTDPPQSSKDCVVSPPPCPTKQAPSSSSPVQGPTPSISPGSTSVTPPVGPPSLTTTGSKDKVSEAATTAAPRADQSTRDAGSASAKPTSASQSPASAQPATPAPGQTDQKESCSPELHQLSNLSFPNKLMCEDRMELTRPTIHLKEAKTCEKWKNESNDISFFESFCSTAQHKFDANRGGCTVKLTACKPLSREWAVQVALQLPLDSEEVLKYLKENDKLNELGIINITSDKMVEDMTINDEFSTPLIITIITLAVSLLLIAAIYGCYQRFSHKKDQNIHPDVPGFDDGHVALIFNQRLTEEMQTMENGYHDNPTLEVMETSSEMQEKKVNLNGELGDSWIVPLDTLMKEDLEEEEDTHL